VLLAGERPGRQRQEQRPEPDRDDRSAMNLPSWLAAAFLLLLLVGCAAGQGPPPPHPIRTTTARIYGTCSRQGQWPSPDRCIAP
jgi:hypothetical protein